VTARPAGVAKRLEGFRTLTRYPRTNQLPSLSATRDPGRLTVIGPTHPFRGGISHYTSLLVRALRTRFQVQFLSYSRQYPGWLYPGNNDRDPSASLLTYEPADGVFDALNPMEWRHLPNTIREHAPGLILLPWSTVYWVPFYACFLRACRRTLTSPVAFVCHNVLEHESSWLKSTLSKWVLGSGQLFLTHSERDRTLLSSWIGPERGNCVWTSPHPVYQHLMRPKLDKDQARAQLGIKADRVVLFFGFIREYKGLRYLLQSLPLIRERLAVHLIVAGEAWERTEPYFDLILSLGLKDSVTFNCRYVPNESVSLYFSAADLVAVPYVSATQSGIVQLAFGFRKPVLVGNVGGLPEVVDDRQTGYLVPPRNPRAIADAVLDFYEFGREQQMAENIEMQLPRFAWERMVNTIGEMIRSGSSSERPQSAPPLSDTP
jgi:glycosyltransferase involved in cell wall biosynthesis